MSEEPMRPTDAGEPTETEVPGRVVVVPEENKVLSVLANGTLRGAKGRFLTGPTTPGIPKGDSEAARALTAMRRDRRAEGAMLGLMAAASEDAGKPLKGVRRTMAHYVKAIGDGVLANAVERPHDASRALDKALKWANLVDERPTVGAVAGARMTLDLAPDVAARLFDVLASLRERG